MHGLRSSTRRALVPALSLGTAWASQAQEWPTKPVHKASRAGGRISPKLYAVGRADEACQIYRIGEHYDSVEETLAKNRFPRTAS